MPLTITQNHAAAIARMVPFLNRVTPIKNGDGVVKGFNISARFATGMSLLEKVQSLNNLAAQISEQAGASEGQITAAMSAWSSRRGPTPILVLQCWCQPRAEATADGNVDFSSLFSNKKPTNTLSAAELRRMAEAAEAEEAAKSGQSGEAAGEEEGGDEEVPY